jgi:hypothetical protein
MRAKYWIPIFILYVFAVVVQENISSWDLTGFAILLLAFVADQEKNRTKTEPHIIGESSEVKYLTQEELERKLKKKG